MTELGEGTIDSRRRVASDELVPAGATSSDGVNALLERLAEARLVTLSDGSAEVAHEALIREWPRLRRWLEEDRAGIRAHRQLGDAARLWDAGGRETSDLYRGARLAGAIELAEAAAPSSTPPSAPSSTPASPRASASGVPSGGRTGACAGCSPAQPSSWSVAVGAGSPQRQPAQPRPRRRR